MHLGLLLLLVAVCLLQTARADFFQHFFQHGAAQQEQEAPPAGDASWFHARVQAAQCGRYLCPDTLACVGRPAECPCPFPQQIRCPYPDVAAGAQTALSAGGSFCVQAADCSGVDALRKAPSFSLEAFEHSD
ncbi:hypothetical protein FA09DRAFT_359997 [Tilletiopsis washingtonensis]|uniref:Long chronological lifespan protein 2 n=1 Tax=Tilletiopsis washingtonensis TaxID=58919 RepID=A0A316ZAX3_9BASI|nr:hypothetical protein FA09DRAFT_359997 [Tilletiopsis washingtonensis]PWN98840.1 hypothetical protein FA09DRAFT_359997 [Tilletiopsis washingtonensis]